MTREVNIYTGAPSVSKLTDRVEIGTTVRVDWTANDGKKYTYTETADLQKILSSLTEEELREVIEPVLIERARRNALAQKTPILVKPVLEVNR